MARERTNAIQDQSHMHQCGAESVLIRALLDHRELCIKTILDSNGKELRRQSGAFQTGVELAQWLESK